MKDLTRVVHHPEVSHEGFASLTVPTYRASTIVFEDADAYSNRKYRGPDGYTYGLHGTPTTKTLEAYLTELEHGERTVIVPSGQAGAAIIFLTLLQPGDKVLIPDTVYPPVRGLCLNYLRARGVEHLDYDPLIGDAISELIDDRTRLVWVESPGSTTMEFQDVHAIAAAAHAKGALVGCDNTWATPLLFKPLDHGADFAMEALTKYVGGHSDILLGSISVREVELHRRLKDTARMLGIGVSPDDCQFAIRGLQTLGVRLAHVGKVAEDFARRIVGQPGVERVLHPCLPTCPGHEVWRRDFSGASGLFSVVMKPEVLPRLDAALSAMKTFSIGASWGGVRSLIVPMDIRPDRVATPWREEGPILRISIGLEDPQDLWDDLAQLFASVGSTAAKALP